MQTDPPGSPSEEFSVRLSWPTAPTEEAEDEPDTAPEAAAPAPAPEVPAPPVPDTVRGTVRKATVRTTASATPARPAPARPAATRPGAAPQPSALQPSASASVIGGSMADVGGSATARPFIDAFDRLSERLLDRLRAMRQDIDADLTALRAEVGAVRQALDESGQGPQVRQLQLSLDEARAEVAALRRAVLEWPELERVSDEVSSMRGELSLLLEGADDPTHPSSLVGELRDVLDQVSEQLGVRRSATSLGGADPLAWLVDEVAKVRSELAEASRRLADPIKLDGAQIERLVAAVSDRVLDELEARNRRTKRR